MELLPREEHTGRAADCLSSIESYSIGSLARSTVPSSELSPSVSSPVGGSTVVLLSSPSRTVSSFVDVDLAESPARRPFGTYNTHIPGHQKRASSWKETLNRQTKQRISRSFHQSKKKENSRCCPRPQEASTPGASAERTPRPEREHSLDRSGLTRTLSIDKKRKIGTHQPRKVPLDPLRCRLQRMTI